MKRLVVLVVVMVIQLTVIGQGLTAISQNEKTVVKNQGFDEIIKGTKGNLYTSNFKKGEVVLTEYSESEGQQLGQFVIKMLDKNGDKVPVVKVIAIQGQFVVFGETIKDNIRSFYYGKAHNIKEAKVHGVEYHSVKLEDYMIAEKQTYLFHEEGKVLGLSYVLTNTETKEVNAHIVTFNAEGENAKEAVINLPVISETKEEVNFETYLTGTNLLVSVYNRKDDGNMATVVSVLNQEGNSEGETRLLGGEFQMQGCRILPGMKANELVVVGYLKNEDTEDPGIKEMYLGRVSPNGREVFGEVIIPIVDQVEVARNEKLCLESVEPIITQEFRIKEVLFGESELAVIVSENLSFIKREDGIIERYYDDISMVCVEPQGGVVWASIFPNRQLEIDVDPINVGISEGSSTKFWASDIFLEKQMITVLVKRPVFDGRMDVAEGNLYLPMMYLVNFMDGRTDDVKSLTGKGMDANQIFMKSYFQFARSKK